MIARFPAALSFLWLAAAVILSGCAGEQKPFDATAHSDIKTIVLPAAGQPEAYEATNDGIPYWLLGGVPGALAGNEIEKGRARPFTQSAGADGLDLGTTLTASVKEELIKAGMPVVAVQAMSQRPAPDAFLTNYAPFAQTGGHGAVLDIVIAGAGYRGTFVLPYRPFMRVNIQLADPATRQVLYSDSLEVDPGPGTVGYRTIGKPPDDCNFSTRDDLMANVSKAGECLHGEAAMIARAIADDFRSR